MIKTLTATTLTQVCAGCDAENAIDVSTLEAGVEDGMPDIIRLPACPTCGSLEFLVRCKSDVGGHRGHIRAVNRLHKRLKDAAQKCTGFPGEDTDATDIAPDDPTINVTL